jgi:hypothetical protein
VSKIVSNKLYKSIGYFIAAGAAAKKIWDWAVRAIEKPK